MLLTDQLNRTIEVSTPPKRIVSLVPSQTELLYDLGLREEVVGITKFCIHPQEWFRSKTRVGGTKQLELDRIRSLQPDLIIANKEENVKSQIEALAAEFPVWISDVNNLQDAYEMIYSLGVLVDKIVSAQRYISGISYNFKLMEPSPIIQDAAYLIWREPWMTIGADTFIHDMLQHAGFRNRFSHLKRYPEIQIHDLRDCALILLSSEPYPFTRKHIRELEKSLPGARMLLVDGEMFSWYGSRLMKAPAYFMQLQQELSVIPKFG